MFLRFVGLELSTSFNIGRKKNVTMIWENFTKYILLNRSNLYADNTRYSIVYSRERFLSFLSFYIFFHLQP